MSSELKLRLELLADDELTPDERDTLLRELGQSPDGWRMCAEALLEAQSYRRAFRPMAVPAIPRSTRKSWARGGLVAASILIAFALGFLWPGTSQGPGVQPEQNRAIAGIEDRAPIDVPELTGSDAMLPEMPEMPEMPEIPEVCLEVRLDNGMVVYTTPRPLPGFLVESLEQAGHRVERLPRSVEVPMSDGETVSLPFVETRITPKENFHL